MPKLTAAQATKLAARRKAIDKELEALNKERAAISEKLLSLDPETVAEGNGVQLSFSPYRQLDTKFIERRFPASKFPELYDLKLSTAEFKKSISANDLAAYQTITYRINIKEIDE